jgi:hypothetical protein
MKTVTVSVLLVLAAIFMCSCETAEEAFVGDRLATLCDEAYWICGYPTGCVLDEDHYVEGAFPGIRRVAVDVKDPETELKIRLFLSKMESPGTELLVQVYETDCTLNTDIARAHLIDVDLFEEAGSDRMLSFDLTVLQAGEHLVEMYSDASVEYLFYIEQK